MKTKDVKRLALSAGAILVLGAGALWTAGQVRQPSGGEGAADMQMDDMSGMDMSGDGTVRIAPEMAHSLGVTVTEAELSAVRRRIRSTGNVAYDETRLSTISPRIGGWIERLHVNFTGQVVRRGQPLLEIYSPELVSAQEELLASVRLERQLSSSTVPGVADQTGELVEAARRRLLFWDISAEQIREIEGSGQVRRTLTLHAPFTGFVVERNVDVGQAIQAGTTVYRLADLSSIWVHVDVYENDLRFVRIGETASVRIDAYPGEELSGRVDYIYPDVRPDTRTGRVRITLRNPDGRIKPGMFATVLLEAPVAERAVVVPRDAVMRTGARDIVFVETGPGAYEIREVRIGADADGKTQVLSGLLAGERVVARANFILDAESRLMETMMGQPGMPGMDM